MKSQYMAQITAINGTLVVTFKTPKIAVFANEEPTRLSTKDTDFFEQQVLRQFFINMSRVVKFQFAAYPEDQARDSQEKFCALHYHAVINSENDTKFKAIAGKKYASVLNAYNIFPKVIMPVEPIFIMQISRTDPEKSYEEYILKHYNPSIRLVTHKDFMKKSGAA
jgi:hypothetical protein